MNTSAKGDRLALQVKQEAEARGLPVVKVRSSGHMGRRGGVPCDVVVCGIRIEAKNYDRGIGSGMIEDCLTDETIPVGERPHAVVHKRARGMTLISMALDDFLDLLAKVPQAEVAEGKGET